MPSLGKYDRLSTLLATTDDINARRATEESLVTIGGRTLQFDPLSRQRMKDVIVGLGLLGKVSWRFADNTEEEMGQVELQLLYDQAEAAIGQRVIRVYQIAKDLKDRLAAGERITHRQLDAFKDC